MRSDLTTLVDEVWCMGEASRRYPGRLHAHCETCLHCWDRKCPGNLIASPAEWSERRGIQVMSCGLRAERKHADNVAPPTRYMGVQHVTRAAACNGQYRVLGGRAAALLLAVLVGLLALFVPALAVPARAAALCDWSEPGANRSAVDAATAIMRLTGIPEDERRTLAGMAGAAGGARHSWRQVAVTRDAIDDGRYVELRNMNFGPQGRICLGPVDRSRWPASRIERGLVYQVGPWAVIVFSACGNVAQLTDTQALPPASGAGIRPQAARPVWLRMPGSAGQAGGAGAAFTVPEPGGLWLLGVALVAAALVRLWARRALRRAVRSGGAA